jgi:mutator protein MutT
VPGTHDGNGDVVRVLAAVIERAGRFLLCQRPAHKRHGGLWEFPGGKLEVGENLDETARRELKEELGLDVEHVGDVAFSVRDPGSPFRIEFVPVAAAGEPQPLEHDTLRWVTFAEALPLPLAPSDRRYVEWRLAAATQQRPQ